MSVFEFGDYVAEARGAFRGKLEEFFDKNGNVGYVEDEMKEFLNDCFERCTSCHEEQALSDNLREEFIEYLVEKAA